MAVYKAYLDTNFLTGDSPTEYDVEVDLGRKATLGYIHNYGTGILTFAISADGTTYGDEVRLVSGDAVGFGGGTRIMEAVVPISKLRITWVSNTSYKIFLN